MAKPLPMNEEKKSLIWEEWERGTPMATIARVIEKSPATVFSYLQYHGGIRPRRRQRRREALGLWMFTSATQAARGNAVQTKIPTDFYGNTFPRGPVLPGSLRMNWMRSRGT